MNTDEKKPTPVEILLVEDNPGDVQLMMEALEDAKVNNRVVHVEDGEIAIQTLLKGKEKQPPDLPDLVLLDLNLPRVHGKEVLKFIKDDHVLKSIPVVILTSSQAEEDIAKSYEYHANCYIIKPIDLDRFMKVVNTIDDFWLSVVKLPKQ
jgi:chemotaxis family two-component system response regulator Rcp1